MKIPFVGQAYVARSKVVDYQECINLYPEVNQATSKNVAALVGTPGLVDFCNIDSNPIRGMYVTGAGRLFVCCGSGIYEITTGGLAQGIGSIGTITGKVNFAENDDSNADGRGLMLVDGEGAWIINLVTNFMFPITLPQSLATDETIKPTHIAFKDGMFIINESGSGYFWYSGLYDANSWQDENGNPYKTEGSSDKLLALATVTNEVWLLGSASTEVWYSTGDSNSPLEKIHGGFSNIGISAPNSLASNGVNLFWLGASAQGQGVIWMSSGYQPQRVSHYGIEQLIDTMYRVDDAFGFCYQQAGHPFYCISFPTAGKTFCYDIANGMWHERSYRNVVTGLAESHLAYCHAFFDGKNIVGDRKTGKLYYFSLDAYTDAGTPIKRVRTTPHIANENKRISVSRFELEMERGNGANGSEMPSVALQSSSDGGYTWTAERLGGIGQIGAYLTRIFWTRCGQARDRIFRISTTAPVRVCIVDCYVEAESE